MNIVQTRLSALLRHIGHVRENCETLGQRLIDKGRTEFGIELIARGQIHDNSKFYGIEWLYLHGDVKEHNKEMFKEAALHHTQNNDHHPEYWGSIHSMDEICIYEMVCDWSARSSEFGNDVHVWVDQKASKKYHFTSDDNVYQDIQCALSLLLEPSFT